MKPVFALSKKGKVLVISWHKLMLLTVVIVAFTGSVFCCRLNHIQELCCFSFSYKTLACVHVLSCQHICWIYIFTGYKNTSFPFNSWLFYLLCTVLKIISWEISFTCTNTGQSYLTTHNLQVTYNIPLTIHH